MSRISLKLGVLVLTILGVSACSGNEALNYWGPYRPAPLYTSADERALKPYQTSQWFNSEHQRNRYLAPRPSKTPPDPQSGQSGYRY